MLPILVICVVSAKLPSQILEVTNILSLLSLIEIFKKPFTSLTNSEKVKCPDVSFRLKLEKLIGKTSYTKELKDTIIKSPNGILLLVSLKSSEILTFINISINKNKIDTAPTYTNKYERPIKFRPKSSK